MSCYCTTKMKTLRIDWYWRSTNAMLHAFHRLGGNLPAVNGHINIFFDRFVASPVEANRVCVPLNCPDPWPPVLDLLFDAAGRNQEQAALFLGGLYCRVAIQRPEEWYASPFHLRNRLNPYKWSPRHYFIRY